MQEEHTEHIDQLDNYYKETLDNASVSPPANMWNRIATAMDEQKKPKGGWSSKKWLLPLLTLLFLSSVVGYFTIYNAQKTAGTNTENDVTPPTSIPTNTESQEENNAIDANQKSANVNASVSSKSKKSTSAPQPTKTNEVEENIVPKESNTPSIETPVLNPPMEPEPVVAPATEKEAPKKKLGFREKHTEALKDSVRPLFVPKK